MLKTLLLSLLFLVVGANAINANNTKKTKGYCYPPQMASNVLQGFPFGGIPTVLSIACVVFMGKLFAFSFLRRLSFGYGARAVEVDGERSAGQPQMQQQANSAQAEQGFLHWIPQIFHTTNDDIWKVCGMDALYYLSFERHLIYLMIGVSVISLAIILPINLSGDLIVQGFGRTTIANLDADHPQVLQHIIFATLYLLLTVALMRCHTSTMSYKATNQPKQILLVKGIPSSAEEEDIKRHFEEVYSNCTVLEVNICHKVTNMINLNSERKKAKASKDFFLGQQAMGCPPTTVNTSCLGKLSLCFNEKVEAVSFYTKKESELNDRYKKKRQGITKKCLNLAFVIFENESMASVVLNDYKMCKFRGFWCCRPKRSELSIKLRTHNWSVVTLPDPRNLQWSNLSVQGILWFLRYLIINSILFIFLFFLTTPAIILTTMDEFTMTKPMKEFRKEHGNPIINQFVPTVLLWLFSIILPRVVHISTFLECHWTLSGANTSAMKKCYFFQIFMIMVLPSLGLSSLDVLFRRIVEGSVLRFECIFLPDKGAFFVNYIITTALIGNGSDLLRLADLLKYLWQVFLAQSAGDRQNIKQKTSDFQYGASYAWMMCVFTLVMTYSIICPIITPFGLLYMIMKHIIDKYNLYNVFIPTKMDKEIHAKAVDQVVTAPILCLFWLLFFSTVRFGITSLTSIVTSAVLGITIVICIVHVFFGYFKYFTTHNYKTVEEEDEEEDEEDIAFDDVEMGDLDDEIDLDEDDFQVDNEESSSLDSSDAPS